MSDSKFTAFTITNTSSFTYNVVPPPGTAVFQIQPTVTSPSLTADGDYLVTDFNSAAKQFTVNLTSGKLTISPESGSSNGATASTTVTYY